MKRVRPLLIGLCVICASMAFGGATQLTCCQKAQAEGKECKHKCCIAAHKDGKSCIKCNPNKEDLKLLKKDNKHGKEKK